MQIHTNQIPIEITSAAGSTKLISYNNIDAEGDKTFYTYFYYMPRGYNIRVPATFGNIEYSAEKRNIFLIIKASRNL